MGESGKQAESPRINGDQVTFIWKGTQAAQVIGDFTYWIDSRAIPMERQAEDLWSCTITLPRDAYIEYGYVVDGERIPDPLNPQQIRDGFGHVNSIIWMPEAKDTPLIQRKRNVPHGTVTRHTVDGGHLVVGGSRPVHLYQPPVDEPVPLLVVLDGRDYLRKAKLANIVDNLIAQKRIHPIAMALVDPLRQGRVVEYACSDTTVAFFVDHLLPYARQHLKLVDVVANPGAYGMMGASMGGLMSLYTAMRAPDIFGHVLCESGAFGGHVAVNPLYHRSAIDELVEFAPVPRIKIWMDCGLYEWFITPNRVMHALLKERGYDVNYVEQTSGHNYPSWRNILWRGLEHLFGAA